MSFKVSVIIPAYNAALFIENAVKSAMELTQVREVIVVDDGSTDNTKAILNEIESEKLQIVNHENGGNKGRAVSRNLGIEYANCEFIAFLDADDYFLPNRFLIDEKLLHGKSNIDGVYNAIGVHFHREFKEEEQKQLELNTLNKVVAPSQLGDALVRGYNGYFSIISLTLRKSFIERIGCFNKELEVEEDTEWIWKAAYLGVLVPGNIKEPVALRGVHHTNSFNNDSLYTQAHLTLFHSMFQWSIKEKLPLSTVELFLERLMILEYGEQHSVLHYMVLWWQCVKSSYRLFFSYLAIKYFPIIYRYKSVKARFNAS